MDRFSLAITAALDDIDEMGHVNNAIWVRWIQDVATAHWVADAPQEYQDAYFWVVIRHEVDYRGNVRAGETVTAETWIEEPPKGARFDRHVRFVGPDGKVKVQAKTTWALGERATGRVARVPPELAAYFLP
jgi:acyl-CoA thioester hydrolase